jgi:hypothetical protein
MSHHLERPIGVTRRRPIVCANDDLATCPPGTFGYLVPIARDESPRDEYPKRTWWSCKCTACGTIKSIRAMSLKSGESRSCGCMQPSGKYDADDLSLYPAGSFGRWTVLRRGKAPKSWVCRCSCDNATIEEVSYQQLKQGTRRSCGCLRREIAGTHVAKKYIIAGVQMTVAEMAEMSGVPPTIINSRIWRGRTPEDAMSPGRLRRVAVGPKTGARQWRSKSDRLAARRRKA